MTRIKRFFIRVFIAICLVPIIALAYYSSRETYTYFNRNEEKAASAARGIFEKICADGQLDANSFDGPKRPYAASDDRTGAYTFVWSRAPEETITISVTYLPYDLPYSMSEQLVNRIWEQRQQNRTQ